MWVCLSGHPRFDVPAFPEFDDAAFRTVLLTEPTMTRANALRMIIGTLDDTHFPWVHEGILGSRDDCRPPEHGAVREGRYLEVHYEIEQPPNLATTDVSAADGQEAVPITYTNHVGMPNVIRLVKDSDSGRYVIWLASCAVAHDVTVNYWAFSRNYDMAPERDAVYREFSQAVRDQDKPIIESQRPVLVPPLDAGVALAMSPADRPLIEYIRWLDELGLTVYP